ncbi:MAG: efflux transporter, family, subunit [Firmicutes bacterium]|nr:efflux transporter, family, subunit [Bacillota bacterium]
MKGKQLRYLYAGIAIVLMVIGIVAGRNFFQAKSSAAAGVPQSAAVKATQVVQRDTPVTNEFAGKIKSKNEVKIMSKVSGNIIAKMVKGGDTVSQGQPLFQIDDKQYRSAIRSANASLLKAQATLNNSEKDLERYQRLAAVKGVSQQTLDAQEAQAAENEAAVAVCRAALQQAYEDQQDTLIVSPVDGRIDVNDISIGQYVTAGSTTMATISSLDPIWVQFSMSENDYLNFVRLGNGVLPEYLKNNLTLVLGNGQEYSLSGYIEQIDKGVGDTTGTITIKASFDNPQHMLLPGMFAKIVMHGDVRKGALLVPQKAVKELLDSTFITVVTADNTADIRPVKMGNKVGAFWIVESGLAAGETIVVDGIDKVKQGTALNVTMVQPDDVQTPVKQ